jgi:hypothetical protein
LEQLLEWLYLRADRTGVVPMCSTEFAELVHESVAEAFA